VVNKRRPGRRAGSSDTRAEILRAARARFTEVGYAAATMRAIATDAGVDAALISYFFGSKQQLFGEAFALRANPVQVIAGEVDAPIPELPGRLLSALITTWDDPQNRPALLTIASAGGEAKGFALTRGFVEEALARPVADRVQACGVEPEVARTAAAVLVTALVGVIYARYVLEVDAVAQMSGADFVDAYTPVVRAAFTGCLPQPAAD
jgi:AcrR family transcriptional regulator